MAKYVSTTISITKQLLRRMRAIGRRVNWSFVCRDAIEKACEEMDAKKIAIDEKKTGE